MESMRELTDIELNEVTGGAITFDIGSVTSTTNFAVVGVQANTFFNGGVGNANAAIGTEAVFIGQAF